MSLAELTLVAILALVILKPADLKSIAKFMRDTASYFGKLKDEIFDLLDDRKVQSQDEQEQINHYLGKIIQISGKYEGEYDLQTVKAHYHKLIIGQKVRSDM